MSDDKPMALKIGIWDNFNNTWVDNQHEFVIVNTLPTYGVVS